ncbi:MAG: hypothetical protein B7Y25_05855 [Alphaproteobacteria bacterium 16-39-46]|nr:MAG: hypothetical protein B7Y25_05855 [Alphaproteobacteria bacterium 16-39-46]OZA42524.1 MAG: hypothetical protein B7X84_05770 [Alphaproteobacteria bacterium 17-39-52]HQS84405.1 phosphatase PAP2 family protein [Alphaproteobacteria bacterium]HQS94214.1 phosphatase PAP2 family protein [Alphaproteobacteria bacterium]
MNELLSTSFFYGAKFFLLFSHEFVIIPILVVGFIMGKKEKFGSALYLLLLTMIFNTLLKSMFQVPLAPHLGKVGFAFPSGHMQSAVVFYGWFFYKTSSLPLKSLSFILLAGCGWALVYLRYHTWIDVFGSIGFGVLTLALYVQFFQKLSFFDPKLRPKISGACFFSIASLFIGFLGYHAEILAHVWMAYYALMGFSLAWGTLGNGGQFSHCRGIFGALGCLAFIFLIQSLFQKFFLTRLPSYLFEMQWFLSAGSLPIVAKMISHKETN